MADRCGDNRFEIIKKAKAELLKSTNIETSEDEMKVLDKFLFRCGQMGWLERYDKPREPLDIPTMTTDFIKEHGFPCPTGYIFKDENGNVINAIKIIVEKKKKEYPKTYEECAEIIAEFTGSDCNPKGCMGYMSVQLTALQKLFICRDAYWKIAGEEMGLGKPWEPNWTDLDQLKYCIWADVGEFITMTNVRGQHILAFPTPEMRDAFYENFKKEIEICKELL